MSPTRYCSATYTLSLHDALPILSGSSRTMTPLLGARHRNQSICIQACKPPPTNAISLEFGPSLTIKESSSPIDRKSTRLNSSHLVISYAVFCLKQKKESGEAQRK